MSRISLLHLCLLLAVLAAGTASSQPFFVDQTGAAGLGSAQVFAADTHGPGALLTDLDNDRYPEIYLIGWDTLNLTTTPLVINALYRNQPDPVTGGRKFVQEPVLNGSSVPQFFGEGAVAADYDNDGDQDIYLLLWTVPNVLMESQWQQTGGPQLTFTNVTAAAGVGTAMDGQIPLNNSLSAAWADANRDGCLDLYVGNHAGWYNSVCGTFVSSGGAKPGQRDIFFLNNCDGSNTFTDATLTYGLTGFVLPDLVSFESATQRYSSSNAVIWADFNNDLWPDLLVTNKVDGPTDRDMLYINQGVDAGGQWLGFQVETYNLGFGDKTPGAMGVDVGDPDRDGDLDIYMTDVYVDPASLCCLPAQFCVPGYQPTPGEQAAMAACAAQNPTCPLRQQLEPLLGNDLWLNTFNPTTSQLGMVHSDGLKADFSWGTQWQDFTNNGYQDLHVATNPGIADFLYTNLPPTINNLAPVLGVAQQENTRGDVSGDFDLDGWVDILAINLTDPSLFPALGPTPTLYENKLHTAFPNHHRLIVKLEGDPTQTATRFRSSRDAIGARVTVKADLDNDGTVRTSEWQIREVRSGSSNAASTSTLALEFGLALATSATLDVAWPSGLTFTTTVAADQWVDIREGVATVTTVALNAP
ncbi:MAG: VCBS repeat-containing protein [Acidobacteriota bacterium]